MAGSGESAEEMGDFNQIRQTYINNIIEGLREAVSLMATLNSNLEVWGERTGELDKLGLVWGAFQNRMTSLSDALTSLDPPRGEGQSTRPAEP
ncbi:protein phosphatase 1 regulatory subunit 35 isoform X1 [Acipenser oxyrinchus oxyrinchus]|uniref:Protein phosphatase 1 regulatory subunit 35 isoform X1 n=1 Tax=Acipenser oxyrinchus oxyrinchus TaxID=40147 RepID=A0AAD8CNR5_ACIOX|nr:protein phosphatase 1 regulatory subunit 35 isoform X1 [Acipenser oxyrinchus oxyrinchus]KAK1153562.1 protein phosphatase 1 regulatory subunit 35 isoform X1 [Acipenser oxyrinchus oxyrinchus]